MTGASIVPERGGPGVRTGAPAPLHAAAILLIGADLARTLRWARRGLVAVHAVPAPGWTVLAAAEPSSRALPPYDDAVPVLLSRPLGHRLRPGLGFAITNGRAVVSLQPAGRGTASRWLVWQPGTGVRSAPGLRPLHQEELLRAARRPAGHQCAGPDTGELARVIGEERATPLGWLIELLGALALPGAQLLHGAPPAAAATVLPDQASVGRFDALMSEEAAHRAGLERA